MKGLVPWLMALMLLTGGVLAAWQAWTAAVGAARAAETLTRRLEVMEKISLKSKKVLETITFSWYDGYSEAMDELATWRDSSQKLRQSATRYATIFLALVLLTLVLYAMHPARWLLLTLLGLSLIALFSGLLMPVFSLVAYKDFPVLGHTVFQYESKSILGALAKLWQQGQAGIAALILLFTVVVPVLKTGLMARLLAVRDAADHPFLQKLHRLMLHLGKWSMLDVFVVAIIVTWFSLREKGSTDAQLQAGLYFFLIYVILSMVIALLLSLRERATKARPEAVPVESTP